MSDAISSTWHALATHEQIRQMQDAPMELACELVVALGYGIHEMVIECQGEFLNGRSVLLVGGVPAFEVDTRRNDRGNIEVRQRKLTWPKRRSVEMEDLRP